MVLRVALLVAVSLTLAVVVWWTAWRGADTQGPLPEAPDPTAPAAKAAPPGTAGGAVVPTSAPPLWRAIDEGTVDVKPPFTDGWSQAGRVLVDVTRAAAAARTWRAFFPDTQTFRPTQQWALSHVDPTLHACAGMGS